jgi:hypothetical protein
MTDPTHQEHRRLCVSCRGEGWTTGPEVNGWPTVSPCKDCRPVTAARLQRGAYAPDAPVASATDAELAQLDPVPRTALWPFPQYLAEWPAPGQRTTTPREP